MGTEPPATPAIVSSAPDWRATQRGTPWLGHALAGGGGALVAAGLIAIGGDLYPDSSDDPGWAGALLCVALVVVSVFALPRVPALVRSALVATTAIGIAGAAGFLLFPGVHGVDDLRGFFALTIAAWTVAFFAPPTRGRTLLLGLALVLAFAWALAEVADLPSPTTFFVPGVTVTDGTFCDATSDITDLESGACATDSSDPNWGELGAVAAIFGVGYLLAVALLDARGRRGTATAFVVPGVTALVLAISFFGFEAENAAVAGAVSVAAGLFCGAIGTQSHRRFTVWTGAFLATVGAVLFAGQITSSTVSDSGDNGATVFGITAIAFGAAMVAVAFVTARLLREPVDGDDEPPVASTAPPSASIWEA